MPKFGALLEDYLAGLAAAKRSGYPLAGYRSDLLGLGERIAGQVHGAAPASNSSPSRTSTRGRCAAGLPPGLTITPPGRCCAPGACGAASSIT